MPLSAADIDFRGYVVTLTRPGEWRVPNGIESAIVIRGHDRIAIGGGRLTAAGVTVRPLPGWDPQPRTNLVAKLPPGPEPMIRGLSGQDERTAIAVDDVLAGYVAGLVLLHRQPARASRLAEAVAERTDHLHATRLRHAALGEVPEPVHLLLASGDPGPLLAFDGASGPAWLRGLISAGYVIDMVALQAASPRAAAEARSGGPRTPSTTDPS